jgi:MFS family permease
LGCPKGFAKSFFTQAPKILQGSPVMLTLKNAKTKFTQLLPFNALDRDLKIIFLSNLLAAFGDGFVVYLLPLFIRSLNATPTDVGLLYTLSAAIAAISIIPGGFLADKFDRKKIILIGWVLWIPIPVSFFFATDWTQLLIPMLIYGITFSAPAVSAYTLDHAKEGNMASAFTTLGSAYAIGYIFSPATAILLSWFFDARALFLFTAVFYTLAAFTLLKITRQVPRQPESAPTPEPTINPRKKTAGLWKLAGVATLFAAMMFFVSLVSTLVPQFQNDIYGFDNSSVFALGTIYYIGAFLLSMAVGKIGDHRGKNSAISLSMLLVSVSLVIFILTDNLGFQSASAFLRGAGFPMWAYVGVMAGTIAPVAQRARWISVVQTTTRVAIIVAPFAGGLLYTYAPQSPFLFASVAALAISALASLKVFKT